MSGIAITIKGADYSKSGYGRIRGEKTTTGLLVDFDAIDNGITIDSSDTNLVNGTMLSVKDWVPDEAVIYQARVVSATGWKKGHGRIMCTGTQGNIAIASGGRLSGMRAALGEMTLATVFRFTGDVGNTSLGFREWRRSASTSAMRWNVGTNGDGHVNLNIQDGTGWVSYALGGPALVSGKAYIVVVTVSRSTGSDGTVTTTATLYLNGKARGSVTIPSLALEIDDSKRVVDISQPQELWASLLYMRALSEEEVKSLGGYYTERTGLTI